MQPGSIPRRARPAGLISYLNGVREEVGIVLVAAWSETSKVLLDEDPELLAVADILHKASDTAIQLCGARGYSRDTVLEWIYRYARCAKLVDGASEVHKMVLSRNLLQEGREFWSWG